MNQFILMADIVQAPQLRYTSDNQTPIADFVVKFPGLRPEDPPSQLKVVGWGNLAQEIQENYREGDRVLMEGRLSMNTFDRPEGFKEKRAEMTVQRIQRLSALQSLVMPQAETLAATMSPTGDLSPGAPATPKAEPTPPHPAPEAEPDYDDIPF